jgi:hypothetical protein
MNNAPRRLKAQTSLQQKLPKRGGSGDSLDALATLAAWGVVIGHWNVQNCDKVNYCTLY